jgi:hypothetical protein
LTPVGTGGGPTPPYGSGGKLYFIKCKCLYVSEKSVCRKSLSIWQSGLKSLLNYSGQVQPSGGHGTPLSTGDPANGGHVGGPASVHSQQQQQVHTPQSYQQHQAVNEYYLQQQQQKMIAAQQQQMSQQMQGQRQASAQQQLAAQQQAASAQSSDNKAFPQLSDFADDALSDAVDLAVPGISSEGIEDFDLDSIEPMRCVDHGGVQHEHGGQNISQQARPIF